MVESSNRFLSLRSVSIGLVLAVLVAVVTPYNDYVVDNSFLVGSYFPPIVAMGMLAIVLLINGPLHKFAPRFAMAPGELAIVMSMALIACAIPSQGLMRELVPLPVAPTRFAAETAGYDKILKDMELPAGLFVANPAWAGGDDTAVKGFYSRLPDDEPIPWQRWIKPLALWGLLAAAFFTSLVSLACLLRYQWAVNERLPFPIVQLQTMLIAPPEKGRIFNAVFSSKGFWIALVAVLVVQSSQVLNAYFPQGVPAIPSKYDLLTTLADEPWRDLPGFVKQQSIYFTLLGVSYFTQTRTSFSLWICVILFALVRWQLDPTATYLPGSALSDQVLGSACAFAAGVLWIGRAHWAMIFRALIGRRRETDAYGAFVSYRTAAIGFLIGVAGMITWLMVAGCGLGISLVIVAMSLLAHFVTARVVAETGLAFIRVAVNASQVITALPPNIITPREAFFYGASHYTFMQSARESPLTFGLHALNTMEAVDDSPTKSSPSAEPHRRRGVVSLLATTLVIAFIACAIASLWCYYRHAVPLSNPASGMLNVDGTNNWPRLFLVEFPTNVTRGMFPSKPHNPWLHMGIGIAVTVILQALAMRYTAWPLLPVGFLMCTTWYMQLAWLSIFLGWLAKVLILRLGGATLFNNLKPVFIGMIFGEAVSMGVWLIVTLSLAAGGYDFKVIKFLPQ